MTEENKTKDELRKKLERLNRLSLEIKAEKKRDMRLRNEELKEVESEIEAVLEQLQED